MFIGFLKAGNLLVAWASPYVMVWRKPEQWRPVCVIRQFLHKSDKREERVRLASVSDSKADIILSGPLVVLDAQAWEVA